MDMDDMWAEMEAMFEKIMEGRWKYRAMEFPMKMEDQWYMELSIWNTFMAGNFWLIGWPYQLLFGTMTYGWMAYETLCALWKVYMESSNDLT